MRRRTEKDLDILIRGALFGENAEQGNAPAEPPAPSSAEILASRYRLDARIGSGGVGEVHRAHDLALQRDVAVKILDARHALRTDLLERFLGESQLCARLEHPGIVPVHDVGLTPDDRPFFVMKLLSGRTLAAWLAEGAEARDAERLLHAFEQLARAVAHAHAHGVVHRDLKPSNVLVDRDGVVCVIDWGFAKLLAVDSAPAPTLERGSEPASADEAEVEDRAGGTENADDGGTPPFARSVAGAVYGTFAYMPPEQAQGRSAEVDERSDVFALGAILCEILTGRAPYAGTREEVRAQARDAALGPALRALEACPADPDLRALARRCLASARAARPTNAGAIVEELARYRRNLGERVRRAELRAATSETRAIAERRTRRWQLGAFAAALALLSLGTWAYARNEREGRERAERTACAVDEALARTQLPLGALEDPESSAWRDAEAALDRARAILLSGDADAATRARVADTASRWEAQLAILRAEHAERERARRLGERLDELRTRLFADWNWERAARGCAELFAELGVSPEAAAAPQELRSPAMQSVVVEGLDLWIRCLANLAPEDRAPRVRLMNLASSLDTDPERARVRAMIATGEVDAELLAEIEAGEPGPAVAFSASTILDRAGEKERARALRKRTHARHPDDFWLAFFAHYDHLERDPAEALRFATALVAARPESKVAALQYAIAQARSGHIEEARALFVRGARQHPLDFEFPANLGLVLEQLGDAEGALRAWRRALELRPGAWALRERSVDLLLRRGALDEARALLEQMPDASAERAAALAKLAWVEMTAGRTEEVVRAARSCLELVASKGDAVSRQRAASAHFFLGVAYDNAGRAREAEQAYRAAEEAAPTNFAAPYNLGLLLELETGRRTEALDAFRRASAADAAAWQPRADLMRMLQEEQRHLEALPVLRELAALESRVPEDLRSAYAEAYLLSARAVGDDRAVRDATEALARLRPSDRGALLAWAEAEERLGHHAAAETAEDRAARLVPEAAGMWIEIGRRRFASGRSETAVAAFESALRRTPEEPLALAWLGRAQLELGRVAEALLSLERAEALARQAQRDDVPAAEWLAACRARIAEIAARAAPPNAAARQR